MVGNSCMEEISAIYWGGTYFESVPVYIYILSVCIGV